MWDIERPFFGPSTGTRPKDLLVAADVAEPIGFIKIRPESSEFGDWYIAGLGVARSHRRRGVARTLLSTAIARAARAGGVWLKVLSTHGGALALCRAAGFHQTGYFPRPFASRPDPDDLRLAKQLP